jgi:hypothetical protein
LGFRLRLNLYNLANLTLTQLTNKFTNNPAKYEESKWLSAKQIDRLGKSFWYHGIHDFLKTQVSHPSLLKTKKTNKSLLRLKYYYFNNGF